MNEESLRALARQHYLFDASLSKVEVIRAIQVSEGNFDCYATATDGQCDQPVCNWRDDCLPASIGGEKPGDDHD